MLKKAEPVRQPPPVKDASIESLRSNCRGVVPLDARLEEWMAALCWSGRLPSLVNEHGSPLNVHSEAPFHRNIGLLRDAAQQRGIDFDVYFARKANKCLAFVDAARDAGCGVDVASEGELVQTLERGVAPAKVICTAAVKDAHLLRRCVAEGVVVAVDNADEMAALQTIVREVGGRADMALRVGGFSHEGAVLPTRFGFDVREAPAAARALQDSVANDGLRLVGIHFHLDGYSSGHRVSGIRQSLELIDQLREAGHPVRFLDIGGGFPMSYLESASQWSSFWRELRRALLGDRPPITYRNHGLGWLCVEDKIHGTPNSYPYYQSLVREQWLGEVLDAPARIDADNGTTIADAVRARGLQLRCEPGRALLDGCGMTVARVEFCKRRADGAWLVGVSMNRTQCRTSSDDFLVDPLLILRERRAAVEPREGYLVGQYCTESELLCLRRLRFPAGVAAGDLVVFPNTAGYFMHFLECRSHQFPLARNVMVDATGSYLDPIDA